MDAPCASLAVPTWHFPSVTDSPTVSQGWQSTPPHHTSDREEEEFATDEDGYENEDDNEGEVEDDDEDEDEHDNEVSNVNVEERTPTPPVSSLTPEHSGGPCDRVTSHDPRPAWPSSTGQATMTR